MKSPEYVYTVTSIYRHLLDSHRSANDSEKRALRAAFSRGGFTDGYFTSRVFSKMTGVRSEDDKNETRELGERKFSPMSKSITARASILRGEPSKLTLTLGGKSVTASGEIPNEAINAPLSEESVKDRLAKLGGTFLSLVPDDIKLSLDEGLNLSPSAINALRRSAAEALTSSRREPANTRYEPFVRNKKSEKLNTAIFLKPNLLTKVYKKHLSSFDTIFVPLFDYACVSDKANGIYLPPIVTDSERARVLEAIKSAIKQGAKYALIGNIGHIELIRGLDLEPIGDFRLNITNSLARSVYEDLGIKHSLISAELTLPMARDIGGGAIIYGRIPLMLTERCFVRENFGCARCGRAGLTDRRGVRFPLLREWPHRMLVLNSVPTYLADRPTVLATAGNPPECYLFTNETEKETAAVIAAARAHGTEILELDFIEGNTRAQRLYEKMGFAIVGFKRNAFKLKDGTYLGEFSMQKLL